MDRSARGDGAFQPRRQHRTQVFSAEGGLPARRRRPLAKVHARILRDLFHRRVPMRSTAISAALPAVVMSMLAGSAAGQCSSNWIIAQDRGEQDHFGRAVALNSAWVAVGAPYDDN